jgi:transposase
MNKYSIKDFEKDFPDDAACLEWLKNRKWPNGIYCEKCKQITTHYRVTNRSAYACKICGNHVYPMAGTILEHSSTPLRVWFHAFFLMANTRCGISAKQLQRETSVTYKTAWRMFKQVRSMLADIDILEGSSVEVDDAYFGGKRRGKRGRGAAAKTIAIAAVQREGRVRTKVVKNLRKSTVTAFIVDTVKPASTIYTDEFHSYHSIGKLGYDHHQIEHNAKIYVKGNVHTNNIEGFWSTVKRGMDGVYHKVSGKYLQDYLNEYAFRYNRRKDERPMFWAFLERLTTTAQGV